jgi:radical SAM superfamily enzyme YgiQ (UPF0313 family)
MAEIWIWNSMARRRRSASDTFEENGIQIIKTYLSSQGHYVKVIDWATSNGFNALSPVFLKKINRYLILFSIKSQLQFIRKFSGIIILLFQFFLSSIQSTRMKRKLKTLAKKIRKNEIKFFGIKLWYGEAFKWSGYLVKQINRYSPETIVIAGGYHATLYQEDILKYSNFDLGITDEGEYVLHELLSLESDMNTLWGKNDYLNLLLLKQQENPIQGLIYRDGGYIKKNQRTSYTKEIERRKAIPQYDPESGKVKVHILIESLGCPWNKCNFCVHNQFAPVYRTRVIEEIIEEIIAMINQGIGLFRFTGSDTPPQFGKSIAVAILSKGLIIEFAMGCRAVRNSKNPKNYLEIVDCFVIMLRAGLRCVFIGGETGNDCINDVVMNKGLNSEDLIYTIKAIRQAEQKTGIRLTISLALIYPTPLVDNITNEEVMHDNIALLNASRPDSVVISPPGPFKNSVWYNEKEKFGFEMSKNIIPEFMEYEYVLYKPLTMWPNLNIKLQGKTFKEILMLSQQFRQKVEKELGIPTDLADEHFLMIRSAGLFSREGIKQFKQSSLTSIVSGDYTYLDTIGAKINNYSRALAFCNF